MKAKHLFVSLICLAPASLWAQLPYQNPALSAHERAVDLCGRLTLEEKASLMLDDSQHPSPRYQAIPMVE